MVMEMSWEEGYLSTPDGTQPDPNRLRRTASCPSPFNETRTCNVAELFPTTRSVPTQQQIIEIMDCLHFQFDASATHLRTPALRTDADLKEGNPPLAFFPAGIVCQ